MSRSLVLGICAYLFVALGMCVWVYNDALQTQLANDRSTGSFRLSEAVSRLKGQLDVYRTLADITSKDPRIAFIANGPRDEIVEPYLTDLALTYGAWDIDLVSRNGQVVAASAARHRSFSHTPSLMSAAFNGRLGYAIEIEDGERIVRFSRGVRTSNATSSYAVVVSANLAALEFEWPVTPEPILFFNAQGLSISANRLNLLQLADFRSNEGERFPLVSAREHGPTQFWSYVSDEGRSQDVQMLDTYVPLLQVTGRILLDAREAKLAAQLRTGLAAALFVALGLIGAILVQQRRQLALESQHSATLEDRVEKRTEELKAAQSELVKASNLAALGRLSAGITHELNQPLAAILNFAENGKRFIQRARHDEANENLSLIASQVRRITRIITNLRAFARQEDVATEHVDLGKVVAQVIGLTQDDIVAAGIEVHASLSDEPVLVLAGSVRLEQVVLNLVSNAVDALQDRDVRQLSIALSRIQGDAQLVVRDTGQGIKEPERVFEPFYTTKELGASKGLGMGLALAFGLVSRFGGTLTCRNVEEGTGAVFTMKLPLAEASS